MLAMLLLPLLPAGVPRGPCDACSCCRGPVLAVAAAAAAPGPVVLEPTQARVPLVTCQVQV
jgi:hypothetical protein